MDVLELVAVGRCERGCGKGDDVDIALFWVECAERDRPVDVDAQEGVAETFFEAGDVDIHQGADF